MSLRNFAEVVWHDFSHVIPELGASDSVHIVLLDNDISPEVARTVPGAASWRDRSAGSDPQILLVTDTSTTALDAPLNDIEALYVDIASRLQDFVMDTLNTPWPLIPRKDGLAVVVEPSVIKGDAYWASHGEAIVKLGHLTNALGR